MSNDTTQYTVAELVGFGEGILCAVGAPADMARLVVESLVTSNLVGHDSHGIMRLLNYVPAVRAQEVDPVARPEVASKRQATAVVDGHRGWGQVAAQLATEVVRDLATEYGVGTVAIRHCTHIGRLGEYAESLARAGKFGIVLGNTRATVAPLGGRAARLGTNPLAWAAPAANGGHPIVLDFATSGVAEGKVRLALARGETLAPGLIQDADGYPSTTPADLYAGGTLLPFGGHKGYALSVMIEIMAGALSGAAQSCLPEFDGSHGTVLLAVNIGDFQPLDQFAEQVEQFAASVRETPLAPGFEGVMLPGEPEAMARRQRLESGIPVPEKTRQELNQIAQELGSSPLL